MTAPHKQDTFSVISLLADASVLATALAQTYEKTGAIEHNVFHARIVKIRKALLAADRLNRLEWAEKQADKTKGDANQ